MLTLLTLQTVDLETVGKGRMWDLFHFEDCAGGCEMFVELPSKYLGKILGFQRES